MKRLVPVLCWGVLLLSASASTAAEAEKRLAVLEFRGTIPVETLMVLADAARAGALSALEGRRYLVMTRESMAAILNDMGMGECAEGECEVETARNIGAELVVTGEVTAIDARYVVTLKLHETAKGRCWRRIRWTARNSSASSTTCAPPWRGSCATDSNRRVQALR